MQPVFPVHVGRLADWQYSSVRSFGHLLILSQLISGAADNLDALVAIRSIAALAGHRTNATSLTLHGFRTSALAAFKSSFIPECLLNRSSAFCEAALQLPSSFFMLQPTRRNSACSARARFVGCTAFSGGGVRTASCSCFSVVVFSAASRACSATATFSCSACLVFPAAMRAFSCSAKRARSAAAAFSCSITLDLSATIRASSAAFAAAAALACSTCLAPSVASRPLPLLPVEPSRQRPRELPQRQSSSIGP